MNDLNLSWRVTLNGRAWQLMFTPPGGGAEFTGYTVRLGKAEKNLFWVIEPNGLPAGADEPPDSEKKGCYLYPRNLRNFQYWHSITPAKKYCADRFGSGAYHHQSELI